MQLMSPCMCHRRAHVSLDHVGHVLPNTSMHADIMILKLDILASGGEMSREDEYHYRIGANTSVEIISSRLRDVPVKVIQLEFLAANGSQKLSFVKEPFRDPVQQQMFVKRIEHMPGFWCCHQAQGPVGKGGVPYNKMILGQGIVHQG
jgi:hypothetical protein